MMFWSFLELISCVQLLLFENQQLKNSFMFDSVFRRRKKVIWVSNNKKALFLMNYSVTRLVFWSFVISDMKDCTVKGPFSVVFLKTYDHA